MGVNQGRVAEYLAAFERDGEIVARNSAKWTWYLVCLTAPFLALLIYLIVGFPGGEHLPAVIVLAVPVAAAIAWILVRILRGARVVVDEEGVRSGKHVVPWSDIREIRTGLKPSRGPSADYASLVLLGDGVAPGKSVNLPPMLTPNGYEMTEILTVILQRMRSLNRLPVDRVSVVPVDDRFGTMR